MDYFIMIPILFKQILCYSISSGFQETKMEAFEKMGSCQFPSASFSFLYFCQQFELGLKHSCCIINIVYNRFTRRSLECNILTMQKNHFRVKYDQHSCLTHWTAVRGYKTQWHLTQMYTYLYSQRLLSIPFTVLSSLISNLKMSKYLTLIMQDKLQRSKHECWIEWRKKIEGTIGYMKPHCNIINISNIDWQLTGSLFSIRDSSHSLT